MDRLELRSQDGKAKSMGGSIQGHRNTGTQNLQQTGPLRGENSVPGVEVRPGL